MKFFLATLAAVLATSSTDAFTSTLASSGRVSTSMANARVDTADVVAEALEISKKFGATSAEARLAWENVEEMDSSDNR